jgi:hypothetical protein
MNGIGKQAAFYRGFLPDDRCLVPLTVLLGATLALWLLVYLVAAVVEAHQDAGAGRVAAVRPSWTATHGACPRAAPRTSVPIPCRMSNAARDLIAGIQVVGQRFVFTTNGVSPVSGWNKVKRRLDARMLEMARAEDGVVPPWRIHDLRRTCATNLQKLGVRLEVTEATLNHVSGTRAGIVGVYQRHQYFEEKRAALDLWAAHVEKIVDARAKRTLPHPVGVSPASI